MVRVFIQHVKALARLQAPAAHACDSSTQQTEGGPEVPHPRYIVSSNPPGLHEPLSQKAGGGGGGLILFIVQSCWQYITWFSHP